MKIRGAVLREAGKPYSIEELELDPPKEKEVLVKYAYAGFCHLTRERKSINCIHEEG